MPVNLVRHDSVNVAAIIGSTLIALLLTGSARNAASFSTIPPPNSPALSRLKRDGGILFAADRFLDARETFRQTVRQARLENDYRGIVMNQKNAAVCSIRLLQFRVALTELTNARLDAERFGQLYPLAVTLNVTSELYIRMGEYARAERLARDSLFGKSAINDPIEKPFAQMELAVSLAYQDRFAEAEPLYRASIAGLMSYLHSSPRPEKAPDVAFKLISDLSDFGRASLKANEPAKAAWAYEEALRIIRQEALPPRPSVLSGLAELEEKKGNNQAAAVLFDKAVAAPTSLTPLWFTLMRRGSFRFRTGDLRGAWSDLREARSIALGMKVDMVPAEQDRVATESGLGKLFEEFIDAGNQLARQTGDRNILEETFNAAEEDRLWSLRSLVPSASDWRNKLSDHYWETLARYQSVARAAPGTPQAGQAIALQEELHRMETSAADAVNGAQTNVSALAHVRKTLAPDTVLFSFHLANARSWLWAVTRDSVDVYPLPPSPQFQREIAELTRALRNGEPSTRLSAKLYHQLFSQVAPARLHNSHWLLEPDGPLYQLPFGALVTSGDDAPQPVYLIERASLASIPGALLLAADRIPANGEFLGVGDPVYNSADERFHGPRKSPGLALPRLPNTGQEIQACARAWSAPHPQLLAGTVADLESVRGALRAKPAIIHFATHVVEGTGDFRSGMIALGLGRNGEVGLLGPREIVARAVTAKLVVMDGCHSAQGEALPASGLMGLTRAWIGSGAMAVMATQWDIPDDSAQSLMTDFYRELHASPERGVGPALRLAQLAALRDPRGRQAPVRWAGYFLLSRLP